MEEEKPGANIDTPGSWAWLESETWRLYTNVAPHYVATSRSQDEIIHGLVRLWGEENVRVEEVAYNAHRQVLPGYKSVFVRRSAEYR